MLFNEPKLLKLYHTRAGLSSRKIGFSALQRAEIAEISDAIRAAAAIAGGFSALQRAEIAEILPAPVSRRSDNAFQCSSTSRNC